MCGHWWKDPQSNNHFCSFFVFHSWYCCKLGPATIAISQTLQICIYRSMYTYIYIPIYVKRILGAAFNAFGCWKVPERGKKKVEKKGKNRKISGIKFHNTANSFFASLKKKKRKKARCCYIFATTINSLSPSAPHPSLITHLDISKEKHAQLKAEIHQADKMNKHRLDREIKYNANQ